MANLEGTKAFSAVLVAGITFMLAGFIGKTVVQSSRPHESAISVGEAPAASAAAAAPAALEPITPLLAAASAQNGQTVFTRQCASCHSVNEGGRNGTGPNLYGIIGASRAHAAGFNYSAALKGKTGNWSYEDMNAWLHKPTTFIPGNRMAYAGLASNQQRADLIAYLRTISPNAPAP